MQTGERRAGVVETADWLKREGIIPIVRRDFAAERVLEIGDALLAAPILCMEVTMNTAGATDLIGLLRTRYGENMRIGAGTVRTVAQFDAAVDAGAQFTLSPSLVLAVVERARERGVLHIPGVFTASEAETAWQSGCPLLKLFPAEQGGPAYLKALRAPLDDIAFVPTGGVSTENAAAWRKAGAVAIGCGQHAHHWAAAVDGGFDHTSAGFEKGVGRVKR